MEFKCIYNQFLPVLSQIFPDIIRGLIETLKLPIFYVGLCFYSTWSLAKKPVFVNSLQVRPQPACSATEAYKNIEASWMVVLSNNKSAVVINVSFKEPLR